MRSVTVALCSIVVLTCMPSQLSARDWQLELGGSWCAARWDNGELHWKETTTRAGRAMAGLTYRRVHLLMEYTGSWFDALDGWYAYDVRRHDALILLGYRVFEKPDLIPCVVYARVSTDAALDARGYGAFDLDRETLHRSYGFGVVALQVLGNTGVTLSSRAAFYPWGDWTLEREGRSTYTGDLVHEELEASSRVSYGGELGIQYRLGWRGASTKASWTLLKEHIEYDRPGTSYHHEHDQEWQSLALGLRYGF